VAWRADTIETRDGWAERLASTAKVSAATVYNRQKQWWGKFGIEISLPCQMYADVLHFGQSSMASPEIITKMLMAANSENGEALVKLYREARANFERDRLEILNPALDSRPRRLLLECPKSDASEANAVVKPDDEHKLGELIDIDVPEENLFSNDDLEDLAEPSPVKVKAAQQSKSSARGVPLILGRKSSAGKTKKVEVVQKKRSK
jgi:hypothetical protein